MKPKLFFFALKFANDNYFTNHVKLLEKYYDVQVISVDEEKYLGRIYSRRALLTLPAEFLLVFLLLLKARPSYVVTAGPKLGLLLGLACRLLPKTTHVHWFTGQAWALSENYRLSLAYWNDFLISKLSNVLMSDSFSQVEFLRDRIAGLDEVIVPKNGSINGLPSKYEDISRPSAFQITPFRICFVGRKSKDKGIELIGELAIALEDAGLEVLITLAGPKDIGFHEYEIWKEKIQKKTDNLKFIDEYVESVDVFLNNECMLLPSLREGFGSVVIEAQACGLPVVCSDIYGLQDSFVDGYSGFRCSCLEDYLKAIRTLMDESEYERFSLNARTFAKPYFPISFLRQLRDAYSKASLLQ